MQSIFTVSQLPAYSDPWTFFRISWPIINLYIWHVFLELWKVPDDLFLICWGFFRQSSYTGEKKICTDFAILYFRNLQQQFLIARGIMEDSWKRWLKSGWIIVDGSRKLFDKMSLSMALGLWKGILCIGNCIEC